MTENGKKYLHAVRRKLRFLGTDGKTYLSELEDCVEEYTNVNPETTVEALEAEFRSPRETAAALLDQWEPEQRQKYRRKKIFLLFLVTILLIVFISIGCIFTRWFLQLPIKSVDVLQNSLIAMEEIVL